MEIIERKCPRIFANGCAAHVMNLLIKDICNLTEFSDTLADAMSVIKFVRNHQHVLAAFQEKRRLFQITHDLVLVVPTRWYSHYNACRYLRAAKFATQALLEDDVAPILNDIQNQEAVDKFKRLTGSSGFWSRLRKLTSVLKFPSEIIGKFEKDDCNLYKVYHYFTELQASWEKRLTLGTNLMTELKAIVTARWNFLHTESMGFAYMLTPKTATLKWLLNDKINTKNELISYISAYYDGDTATECVDELNTFLTMYPTRPMTELNEYNKLSGIQYWAQYGMSEYPLLSSIAIRVFSIPTSSAAAERGWSIFSFLHTKRRNRLTMEKLEKLAFVYINHALLDKHDKTDYIKLYLQDE